MKLRPSKRITRGSGVPKKAAPITLVKKGSHINSKKNGTIFKSRSSVKLPKQRNRNGGPVGVRSHRQLRPGVPVVVPEVLHQVPVLQGAEAEGERSMQIAPKHYCMLCYKEYEIEGPSTSTWTIDKGDFAGTVEEFKKIVCARYIKTLPRFLKLHLLRYVNNQEAKKNLESFLALSTGVGGGNGFEISSCDACFHMVKSFCDLYSQSENILLQLELNIQSMSNVMKSAERVGPRVKTFKQNVLDREGGMQKKNKEILDSFKSQFQICELLRFPVVSIQRCDMEGKEVGVKDRNVSSVSQQREETEREEEAGINVAVTVHDNWTEMDCEPIETSSPNPETATVSPSLSTKSTQTEREEEEGEMDVVTEKETEMNIESINQETSTSGSTWPPSKSPTLHCESTPSPASESEGTIIDTPEELPTVVVQIPIYGAENNPTSNTTPEPELIDLSSDDEDVQMCDDNSGASNNGRASPSDNENQTHSSEAEQHEYERRDDIENCLGNADHVSQSRQNANHSPRRFSNLSSEGSEHHPEVDHFSGQVPPDYANANFEHINVPPPPPQQDMNFDNMPPPHGMNYDNNFNNMPPPHGMTYDNSYMPPPPPFPNYQNPTMDPPPAYTDYNNFSSVSSVPPPPPSFSQYCQDQYQNSMPSSSSQQIPPTMPDPPQGNQYQSYPGNSSTNTNTGSPPEIHVSFTKEGEEDSDENRRFTTITITRKLRGTGATRKEILTFLQNGCRFPPDSDPANPFRSASASAPDPQQSTPSQYFTDTTNDANYSSSYNADNFSSGSVPTYQDSATPSTSAGFMGPATTANDYANGGNQGFGQPQSNTGDRVGSPGLLIAELETEPLHPEVNIDFDAYLLIN